MYEMHSTLKFRENKEIVLCHKTLRGSSNETHLNN